MDTHAGVDWSLIIGIALGAAAMVGVLVATHKVWRVGFGVGGWLLIVADAIYATSTTGVGIAERLGVAALASILVGVLSWLPIQRFLREDTPASAQAASNTIDDVTQRIIPAATAGILVQVPLFELEGRRPFDASDGFAAELYVRGPNDFGLGPRGPAEAVYETRLPEGYELPDGTRLARPTFYWMLSARTTATTFPVPGVYQVAGGVNWTSTGKSMEISRGVHVRVGPGVTATERAQLAALKADLKRRAWAMHNRLEDITVPLKGKLGPIRPYMDSNEPAARAMLHGWETVIQEEQQKAGVLFRQQLDELKLLLDEFRDTFQITNGRREIWRLAKKGWPEHDDLDKITDLFFHMIRELDNG